MSAPTTKEQKAPSPSASAAPTLPPLYFAERGSPLKASSSSSSLSVELPAELLHTIVATYNANWGDLAKLATVQSRWSSLVADAASASVEAKWDLAQALLHGRQGLQPHPALAVKYLHELANVPMHELVLNNAEDSRLDRTTTPDDADGWTGNVTTNATDGSDYDVDDLRSPAAEPLAGCFAPALRALAQCYLDGHGVSHPCTATGLACLRAAFTHGGDATAAHRLGVLYERDYQQYDNLDVDVFLAATWFEKGAHAGHIESMAELGLCFELGCGKEQSDEQALEWYLKAARAGHITAKYSVAEAFEQARGVPQSDEEACLWYYQAAVDGCHDSKQALHRLLDIARIVVPGVRQLLFEA